MKERFEINPNVLQDVADHLDNPDYCAMRIGIEAYPQEFGLKDMEDMTVDFDYQNIPTPRETTTSFKKRAERRRRTRNKLAYRVDLATQKGYSRYMEDPRAKAFIANGEFGRMNGTGYKFWCDSDKNIWDEGHLPIIEKDDTTAYNNFLDASDYLEDLNEEIMEYNKVVELEKIAISKTRACQELAEQLRQLMHEENNARNAFLEARELYNTIYQEN